MITTFFKTFNFIVVRINFEHFLNDPYLIIVDIEYGKTGNSGRVSFSHRCIKLAPFLLKNQST